MVDRNGNHVNGGKLNGGNGDAMPPTHLVSTNDRLENHRDPSQLRLIDSIVDTRQATDDLIKLVQKLNQAMNAADRIGLVVKPDISTATSQFGGTGSAGHMASIKVSRKLC